MRENSISQKSKQILLIPAILGVIFVAFFAGSFLVKDGSSALSEKVLSETDQKNIEVEDGFLGDPGERVVSEDVKVYIQESKVRNGNMQSFTYYSEKYGKNIYFFIVKASDGTYRAAANACEVCHASKKGFKQVGNQIRCENCQVTYSKDAIAENKGGCNPGPINKDVQVEEGQLVLEVADMEKTAYLF